MISLVDTAKFRRAISFNGGSLDQNSNEVKGTKRASFRRRLFRSMTSRRAATSLDEASSSSSASSSSADVTRTISSDTLLNERNAISFTPSEELRSPGSFSSNSSNDRKGNDGDDVPRQTVKKKKYFSSERNKNLLKKLLHPNYQERNAQYRKLFGNVVPEDDLFLISFSCAYQREILCQGRMYISQRHICFHANILGWETRLAIPIDQVALITKEKAALIFPNSIQLETLKQEKYFFASFVNREKTSTALSLVQKAVEAGAVVSPEEMWEKMNPERQQISSPLEKPGSNGRHRGGDGIRSSASSPLEEISLPSSLASPSLDFAPVPEGGQDQMSRASSVEDLVDASCPCPDHFGRLLLDAVFPLSVGELYRLVFHDETWSRKFNQVLRNTGYEASAWAKDKDGVEGRICTYTMELNHAMAPKNCVVTEKQTIQHLDEQMDVVVIHKETQNSGVPYADHFTVNCNYCLTRVGSGQTRLKVHGGLNYRKTIWSMVKGYIEKSTYQGLEQHYTALETTLKNECAIRATTTLTTENDDRDSVASSVEDPSPESPRSSRTTVAAHPVLEQILSHPTVYKSSPVPVQPDYSPYIRIIICLLAGLCLLQLLLLFRPTGHVDLGPLRTEIQTLSKRLSSGQLSETTHTRETEMLQTLLSTVEQLAADLQKMKREREEL